MPEKENNTKIEIEGMTCSGCAATVTKFLQNEGMTDVNVDFTSGEAFFNNIAKKNIDELNSGLKKIGYNLKREKKPAEGKENLYISPVAKRFWFTLPFSAVLMLHMLPQLHFLHNHFLQFVLCIPAIVAGYNQFGRSSIYAIKNKTTGMDVLIFLGSSSAFTLSIAGLMGEFFHFSNANDYIYFETASSIITLALLGSMIEQNAVKRTAGAVSGLEKMQNKFCSKIIIDSKTKTESIKSIAISDIKIGDRIQVNEGNYIPVDGKILRGEAWIDESLMSGESLAVHKKNNDKLFAGTIITKGNFSMMATAESANSSLAKIIDLVKSARADKPNIQRLGDKISSVFVPIVLVISLLTFFLNLFFLHQSIVNSLLRSVAVLVISCPCAMGLAAPIAVVVGIGKAARNGILIKGGSVLEELSFTDCVIFDKTGTLTTGNFKISNFSVFDFSERDAKNIIHYFEKFSSHPIAKTILEKYSEWNHHTIGFNKITEEKGAGIRASDSFGNRYTLGSIGMVKELKSNKEFDIYLTMNEKIIAAFDVDDEIKNDAKLLVDYLKKNNIKTFIISGDSKKKCDTVKNELGIDEVYSRQLPEQKLRLIKKLSKQYKIAMLGDGNNDAPSLIYAKVGITFGNATDAAREASQVILNGENIMNFVRSINISKATYKVIKQNFFWAFIYNALCIPLAAIGFVHPLLAALGMAFSDLVVVGNSLRLRFMKI